MSCYLIHILQEQDQHPYEDPAVKDIVGALPRFFCTRCDPIKRLLPSQAMLCIDRDAPCWRPLDRICDDD